MNVKPIPNKLLGDNITLMLPTANGTSEKTIKMSASSARRDLKTIRARIFAAAPK